jgi:formylglycine-generating enzyme required for sulfatase activity
VWEWTRSLYSKGDKGKFGYPYAPLDGRENMKAPRDWPRALRGGLFSLTARYVRCAHRNDGDPVFRLDDLGFRVVVSPFVSEL